MASVSVRWIEGGTARAGGAELLTPDRPAESIWWVDITEPDEATMLDVGRHFDLHPLEIEDVLHLQHRPKIDLLPEKIFVSWLTPRCDSGGACAEPLELDIIIGRDFLITAHNEHIPALEKLGTDNGEGLSRGPDWAVHRVIDELVDTALPMVDAIGEQLDDLEDAMVRELDPEQLTKLHHLRRDLIHLHRIVSPERDIVRALARERDVVSQDAYRYFLDVGDHLARVEDAIETYRDVASSVMDIYLSVQNNRMNDIMKQLAVVATIFMPLTLISGIYGMNVIVGMWPPVTKVWSFWAVLIGMVGIGIGMLWYFRRKRWW